MRRQREHTVGELTFTAKELTVEEIAAWVDAKINPSGRVDTGADLVALLLPVGELVLGDLFRMTDLTMDQVRGLAPGELEAVVGHCKELNQSFFAMAGLVAKSAETTDAIGSGGLTETAVR